MNNIKKFIKENTFLTFSLILLFVVLTIIAVAYIPNIIENKNKIDYTDLENNATDGTYLKIDDVNCVEMALASNSYSDFFITSDGRLFKYDMNRMFDNYKNCKEITWDLPNDEEKATSIFSMTKNGNNYVYVLGGTEFDNSSINQYKYDRYYQSYLLNSLNEYELTMNNYASSYSFIIPSFENTTIFQLVNSKAVIIDGILYNIKLNVETGNMTPKFVYDYKIEDVAFKPREDESIVKILDTIIITNKRVYTYDIVDNSCMKYVDRECQYGYKENKDLSRIVNEILFIDEYHVVLNGGTTYAITTYGLE